MNSLILFFLSLFLSLLLYPFLIKLQKKRGRGQIVREEGPKNHLSKKGTPTMGGILFILIPLFFYLFFIKKDLLTNNLIIFVILQGSVGLMDDILKLIKRESTGLLARWKLLFQILFALPFIIYIERSVGTRVLVPFSLSYIDLSYLFIPFLLFIIVGGINSFNITDGLDGLLGGLSILLLPFFLVFFSENEPAFMILIMLAGVLIGFLWYNFHPAQIFMGDTGSMILGSFFIGISLVLRVELFLPVLMFIFVVETLSVIIQVLYFKWTKKKYGAGKRVFRMAPIHHHFELMGIPEEKVTLRFWIVQTMLLFISFLILGGIQ